MKFLDWLFFRFLNRIYDAKATEDLEALCNDEAVMQQWAAEELEWQPYPVPEEEYEYEGRP